MCIGSFKNSQLLFSQYELKKTVNESNLWISSCLSLGLPPNLVLSQLLLSHQNAFIVMHISSSSNWDGALKLFLIITPQICRTPQGSTLKTNWARAEEKYLRRRKACRFHKHGRNKRLSSEVLLSRGKAGWTRAQRSAEWAADKSNPEGLEMR